MSGHEPKDWETMEAIEPQAGEMLERTMARYARVRLEPTPAQVRRARTAAMEAAWRSRIEAQPVAAHQTARRLPFSGWTLRRVSLAATAAVFAGLLLGSSVFAASRAGGPLYGARIALENATLPADASARLQAEIANAQVRLAEAYDAEARNDQGALAAALQAYAVDATSLAQTTGPDSAQVLAAVQQHRDVLLSLLAHANANAVPGLTQALANSDKVIQQLSSGEVPAGVGGGNGNPVASGNPGGGNGNAGAGGNPGGGNGNAGASGNPGGGNGNPGAGNGGGVGQPQATPAPTSQPDVTPKPGHSPKPAPTPKPDHTPRANPSANSGGGGNRPAPGGP